jgi:diamine N-acetyltransferase
MTRDRLLSYAGSALAPHPSQIIELTPLRAEHAPAMARWMEDKEIVEGLGLSREPSAEYTEQWVARALEDPSYVPFAVLAEGEHVGCVILDQIDRRLGLARLSIYLGPPEVRNRGIGQTAVRLALAHAFRMLGLFKVWLTVHEGNVRAITAYERCGFVIEGVLRGEFLLGEERLSAIRMGVLADDFSTE